MPLFTLKQIQVALAGLQETFPDTPLPELWAALEGALKETHAPAQKRSDLAVVGFLTSLGKLHAVKAYDLAGNEVAHLTFPGGWDSQDRAAAVLYLLRNPGIAADWRTVSRELNAGKVAGRSQVSNVLKSPLARLPFLVMLGEGPDSAYKIDALNVELRTG